MIVRNYLDEVRKHEEIFRNILRSLKIKSLDTEASLEDIFEKYSKGMVIYKGTIFDFRVGPYESPLAKISENEALFSHQDLVAIGQGRIDKYKIKPNNSIEFDSNIQSWRS